MNTLTYLVFNVIILCMIVYLVIYMCKYLYDDNHHIAATLLGVLGAGGVIMDVIIGGYTYKALRTPVTGKLMTSRVDGLFVV